MLQMRTRRTLAKDGKAAVYNLNDTAIQQQQQQQQDPWNDRGQAYATDWWNGYQAPPHGQQIVTTQQGMQAQQQQHGIQRPVQQQAQAVSGPLIAMTPDASKYPGTAEENIIDLMIDSGAATHVCPHWFAPIFQLHQLPKGDEPQLRTVTNTQIKVHGYKCVIMRNNKKQPIVIPLYVCDAHAPIMSVTRLAEQGFKIQLNETPTMTHKHGFEAADAEEGTYSAGAEMTHLPPGPTLAVKDTEAGQPGMIAPMAMSDTGMRAPTTLTPTHVMLPQAGGGNAD